MNDRAQIAETRIKNNDHTLYGTNGGSTTNNYIFLLSIEEVFGMSRQLRNQIKGDWGINNKYDNVRIAKDISGTASWWLRSPGFRNSTAAIVKDDGYLHVTGIRVTHDSGGVRPALLLKL